MNFPPPPNPLCECYTNYFGRIAARRARVATNTLKRYERLVVLLGLRRFSRGLSRPDAYGNYPDQQRILDFYRKITMNCPHWSGKEGLCYDDWIVIHVGPSRVARFWYRLTHHLLEIDSCACWPAAQHMKPVRWTFDPSQARVGDNIRVVEHKTGSAEKGEEICLSGNAVDPPSYDLVN